MNSNRRHSSLAAAVLLWMALLCPCAASALNFKAGNYLLDNSKLKFSSVKMLVGNVTRPFTMVLDMQPVEASPFWLVTIPHDIYNLDYFTFVETDVQAGIHQVSLSAFLDSLSAASGGLRRTGLKGSSNIVPDTLAQFWVYCPFSGGHLPDGYWRTDYSYQVTASGTLPVVYLNTRDSMDIVSKDYYIEGSLWIDDDTCGLASSDQPLDVEVKGRGNWTWRHSFKRPYKIKFATKQSPLGLDRSRHFVLLAHNEDYSGYLRCALGFELSRLLAMPYTPRELPVELVLNGEYMGLYFLCEKIRVENGRVNIVEQPDMETIPHNVTGGWLLELTDDGDKVIDQYQNNNPALSRFSFVSHSPEVLSQQQRTYIHDLLARADSCIYVPSKDDRAWEQLIDIGSLARFYVIHEVMENVEAFSGSLFIYKDLGWDEKLIFGPVWDFDNSFFQESTTGDHFIYDYATPYPFLWIKEALKFPRFQQQLRAVWHQFCQDNVLDSLNSFAWRWRELVAQAEQHDALRWHQYASTHGPDKPQQFIDLISKKAAWLNAQWGTVTDVNLDGAVTSADATAIYCYLLDDDHRFRFTADVDRDGKVTAADLTAFYNIILQ